MGVVVSENAFKYSCMISTEKFEEVIRKKNSQTAVDCQETKQSGMRGYQGLLT